MVRMSRLFPSGASPARNGLVNTSRRFTNDMRLCDGVLKWIREAQCEPRSHDRLTVGLTICPKKPLLALTNRKRLSPCSGLNPAADLVCLIPALEGAAVSRCSPLRFAQSDKMVKVLMEHDGEAPAGIYRQLKAMTAHVVAVALTHGRRFPVGQ